MEKGKGGSIIVLASWFYRYNYALFQERNYIPASFA